MKKYDFENSVGFVVNSTAKAFQKVLDSELRKNVGVNITQWRVISILVLQPGSTQKEIADKVGVESPTLVPVIDKMARDGLLKRKVDVKDRRVNRIYLTSKANSLWDSMMECALRIRRASLKDIPAEEIEITLETLRKISNNLVVHFELDNLLTLPKKTKS